VTVGEEMPLGLRVIYGKVPLDFNATRLLVIED
jgi:hypothetical protein